MRGGGEEVGRKDIEDWKKKIEDGEYKWEEKGWRKKIKEEK